MGKFSLGLSVVIVVSSLAFEVDVFFMVVFFLGIDVGFAFVERMGAEGMVFFVVNECYVIRMMLGFVEWYDLEVMEGVGIEIFLELGTF